MSRRGGFLPWWRLAPLPGLVVEALRHDRAFRWTAAGAFLCLAVLLGRGLDVAAPSPAAEPRPVQGEVAPVATSIIPPPAAPGPLPNPVGPSRGAAAPAAAGPIAPSVPLGPAPTAPRDTFGTVPTPRGPAP